VSFLGNLAEVLETGQGDRPFQFSEARLHAGQRCRRKGLERALKPWQYQPPRLRAGLVL